MQNERRKPQDVSDEEITLPLDPETALEVPLGDDDVAAMPTSHPRS